MPSVAVTTSTVLLAFIFSFLGAVKVGGGKVLSVVHALEMDAFKDRYIPALATLKSTPRSVAVWLIRTPPQDIMYYIGVPELAFGVTALLSIFFYRTLRWPMIIFNMYMLLHMVALLVSHIIGDDFTDSFESNVGPAGILPAAVVTVLLVIRIVSVSAVSDDDDDDDDDRVDGDYRFGRIKKKKMA
eukprot:g4632.t1